MDYPFELCINSLLSFCDEVCVADAGSEDGTVEFIKRKFPSVRIEVFPVDFSKKRWAIHSDGLLKDKARKMCSGDVLWHADNDEIVDVNSVSKAKDLCEWVYEHDIDGVLTVPFYEFWGSLNRIRMDVLSRPAVSLSSKNYSIGIPEYAISSDGDDIHCKPFLSDSCQYIKSDGSLVPIINHPGSEVIVWHLSWLDFKRKIRHYKEFWSKFHASMYNLEIEDIAENNVMFDKAWSEVSEDDIKSMADKLSQMGPRSFHEKESSWLGAHQFINKNIVPAEISSWAADRGIA